MEKRKPTYRLTEIKSALGSVETLSITVSAYRDATTLGFDRAAIVDVILGLDQRMFVKSMTTNADHRIWQDVYNVPAGDLTLYVKFQANVLTSFTVMAFKEK